MEEFLNLIKNLNIVITGTSRGVGLELTKKLLIYGNNVWGCSRNKSIISNKKYFHTRLDLCKEKNLKDWIGKIEKQSNKKIDILILNSSIFNRSLNSLETDTSIIDTLKINLLSPILIVKYISRLMVQNRKGTIIFFSSIASVLDEIGTSSYASAKSGLETFSKIIQKELKPFRINVSAFRILYISTKLSNKLKKGKIESLKKKFKSNKFGSIEKILKNIVKIHKNKKNFNNSILSDSYK